MQTPAKLRNTDIKDVEGAIKYAYQRVPKKRQEEGREQPVEMEEEEEDSS